MIENPKIIKSVKIILGILYLVGIVGFSFDETYPIFVSLTSFNLLLTTILLFVFHQQWTFKAGIIFLTIGLLGFLAEMIGVNTQLLFGQYTYGRALGFQLNNTPLLIGANWLLLSYCIFALLGSINHRWFFPFLGALLMVGFDFVMEPVATALKMWEWQTEQIPLKNYLDWYLVSLFVFSLMRAGKLQVENKLAIWILFLQLAFFLSLNLTLNLI
jgi:putative membrane protein